MTSKPTTQRVDPWPPLPLLEWSDTCETVHLWTQIVGKTRLALAPMQNHWWNVSLYVTSRGMGTSPMPHGERTLEIDFDFVDHLLIARVSDGVVRSFPLVGQSVASFYERYRALLGELGFDFRMLPHPVEMACTTPFAEDREHASYDPEAVERFWSILVQSDRVLKRFRGRFLGKCSPVHFWWGAFDLACTRFSGRPAPPHPGGIPNTPDFVTREGYSHECISVGWWPGMRGGPIEEPVFYAYAYPEPPGCPEAVIRPAAAGYNTELHEWVLPYDAVRRAPDREDAILDFAQSTYEAAASLMKWNRPALER